MGQGRIGALAHHDVALTAYRDRLFMLTWLVANARLNVVPFVPPVSVGPA